MPLALVLMGVAGCGKSTVGEALAAAIDGRYIDGDALHPDQNIAKMARGAALQDQDTGPGSMPSAPPCARRQSSAAQP